jgi:hypothetical protein
VAAGCLGPESLDLGTSEQVEDHRLAVVERLGQESLDLRASWEEEGQTPAAGECRGPESSDPPAPVPQELLDLGLSVRVIPAHPSSVLVWSARARRDPSKPFNNTQAIVPRIHRGNPMGSLNHRENPASPASSSHLFICFVFAS